MAAPVVRRFLDSAGALHAQSMPTDHSTELWVMRPSGPALAMGSAQRAELFDRDALAADGVELAERRSGGGAVFINPDAVVWIDAMLPTSSDRWSSDLAETFLGVGRAWQRAFASLGVPLDLCDTKPARSDAGRVACWASVGWGELTCGGAKIVGLSQRRTRWGARVQAMAVLDASAPRVADYLVDTGNRALARSVVTPDPHVTERLQQIGAGLEEAVLHQFV